MVGMIILSFVLAYPVFIAFVYLLVKVIFSPLDKIADEQQKERINLLLKAKRIRRSGRIQRLVHT